MKQKKLPTSKNIYHTECPILYAMDIIGQKWKLPVMWYIGAAEVIRYKELQRKVIGITPTMLTKCLKELENDDLIIRTQYNTIPPAVEYSLTANGKEMITALEPLYKWAEKQMNF